jgi:hypothetical protein
MRVLKWFSLFMLLGVAVALAAAAPAGAQGSGSDVGGGSGATLSRTDGSIAPAKPLPPASLEPIWMSVQTVFGRYPFPVWARAWELGRRNPAWLPLWKREAR